jgi:two-component system sensor histidine kinase/response regulator
MAKTRPIRILYMEDDPGLARLFQRRLRRAGYIVDVARDGEEGLAMYTERFYDVVATDQAMPVHSGLEVIRILASQGPLPPTIMVTGTGSEQIAVEAMKLGASDYIVKDVDGGYLDLLPAVIDRVLQQQRLLEEKRQAEEALRKYAAELEARNEELDGFAHTVAHDLKGPLSHMVGFARVLAEDHGALSEGELLQYLQTIAQSGQKMSNIIDELLLLASVRKIGDVKMVPLDMSSIVADVLTRLDYMVEESRVEITLPQSWPVGVGYGPWVEEVWVNYLSNAIKYGGQPPRVVLGFTPPDPLPEGDFSPRGDSSPRGDFSPRGSGRSTQDPLPETRWVQFWVRDNGVGLTPDEQGRLFTLFTRLEQTRVKGHGLGLSIVRRIVDKLGGEVGVESEAGEGSTFWFTLPAQ